MKPTNSALNDLLRSGQFFVADLYVITLSDGTVLRYSAGDQDIVYDGDTYPCGGTAGPYFERIGKSGGLFSQKIGLEVNTLEFDVIPKDAEVEGFPWLAAVRYGMFDGATVELFRAYMPTYGDTTAGVVNIFTGLVTEVFCDRSHATFHVASHTELLNMQMPRNLYQPGCMNTLYDTACTLNRASFAVNSAAGSGCTLSVVTTSLSQASGYFDLGTIVFTSGNNDGITRSVKSFASASAINLLTPLPFAPANGDTFTIYPGCDKTNSTCSSKFSNLANFRGQPFIPQPETSA